MGTSIPYQLPFQIPTGGGGPPPSGPVVSGGINPNPSTVAAAIFGVDIVNLSGLDPNLSVTPYALIQDVYHLVTTPPGSIFWAPAKGFDVRGLLSGPLTNQDIQSAQSQIESQLEDDERISRAQALITPSEDGESLSLTLALYAQTGQQFNLVIAVNQLTTQLVSVS